MATPDYETIYDLIDQLKAQITLLDRLTDQIDKEYLRNFANTSVGMIDHNLRFMQSEIEIHSGVKNPHNPKHSL